MEKESYWIYTYPFPKNISVSIQKNSTAHTGPYIHAIDFLMAEGSEVLAPRSGQIIQIKKDSNNGGPSRKFENDANYVTIAHGHNEFSQLVHLKYNGVFVKNNQQIKEGELIAYTGSTGWTYKPHIHFMVFEVLPDQKFQSLKIRFRT